MNISDSVEQSSSKRQENGDAPSGSERPLKKARFAWQVKGKYHLRNDVNDTTLPSTSLTNEPQTAGPSPEAEVASGDLVGSAEQNLEILGDYLLKQDFNTLDSVIADSEKTLLKPSTSISTENLPYPRYVSSSSYFSATDNYNCTNELDLISMSMVLSYSEDQCIARWQAKQMAKGFVDNTINRVLDSWTRPHLPPSPTPVPNIQRTNIEESRFLALDIADFINNLPGDNSVENEGILMAISAHGLQNTSSNDSNASETDSSNSDNDNAIPPASKSRQDIYPLPPCPPTPSKEEIVDTGLPFIKPTGKNTSWSFPKETEGNEDNELAEFAIYDSSDQYFENDNDHSSPSNDYSDIDNFSDNHFDFMDTAVSYAILNKGLTTFGNDYG